MEKKKNWLIAILIIIIAALCLLVGILLGNKNFTITDEKENNNIVNKIETDNNKDNINKNESDNNDDEVNKAEPENNEESEKKCVFEVGTIKNIHDVILYNDTNSQKAQKIAKEIVDAVNNKDWYYLAKMVGSDADNFINYGIYNYSVDVSNYRDIEGTKFVFTSKYDWDKTKLNSLEEISLGTLLVITFEDGGRINIEPNCSGA